MQRWSAGVQFNFSFVLRTTAQGPALLLLRVGLSSSDKPFWKYRHTRGVSSRWLSPIQLAMKFINHKPQSYATYIVKSKVLVLTFSFVRTYHFLFWLPSCTHLSNKSAAPFTSLDLCYRTGLYEVVLYGGSQPANLAAGGLLLKGKSFNASGGTGKPLKLVQFSLSRWALFH